jgi:hypothetical protein
MTMAKHHLTHAAELYHGCAYYAPFASVQKRRGVPIKPPTRVVIGTPIVGDANGICESQSITAAGTGVLNGAVALAGIDVPRTINGAWTTTAVATVTGTDVYGEVLVESSASGTSLTGKKAFATVTAVDVSVDVTSATFGTGDLLGLPYRVNNQDEIHIFEGGVPVATGTFAAAVTTDPATATTGDVRGTLDPTVTLDGSARVVVEFLALDPDSKESLFGVAQYGG